LAQNTIHKAQGKRKRKPPKPRRDFPLQAHANGSWAKRINGKLYYFGPWSDPVAAEQKYHASVDDIRAGRRPNAREAGTPPNLLTLVELCDRFMAFKADALGTGDIGERTFADYFRTCELLIKFLGRTMLVGQLGPSDFQRLRTRLAKGRNSVSLGNEVRRARVLFRWAYEDELISAPVRFGQSFKLPGKPAMRRARASKGALTFEPEELRLVLDAANPEMRAAILLGLNGGLTNGDIAGLERHMISDDRQWIRFSRRKTGVAREIPLWPETRAALEAISSDRPQPRHAADADAVFLTRTGRRLARVQPVRNKKDPQAAGKRTVIDALSTRFRKLLEGCGLHQPRRNFYSLRHQFWSEAEAVLDIPAARRIMGHVDRSISDAYREYIAPERLRRVTDHVRAWLFAGQGPS
jgi:integrase